MSKVSNKLAAGMRKVKIQESKPKTVEAAERKTEVSNTAIRPVQPAAKPAPAHHPARVWPD